MNKPLSVLPFALLLALSPVALAVPVRVQVLGPGHKPVPGAPIRVRFWSLADPLQKAEPLSAVADAQGMATFEAPDEAPGERGELGVATTWSSGLAIDSVALHAGLNQITLGTSGVARGLVVDGAGRPVPNALVQLVGLIGERGDPRFIRPLSFTAATDAAASQVRTDAQGRWSIGTAPLGSLLFVNLPDDKLVRAAASSRVLAPDAAFDWAPLGDAARLAAQAPAIVPEDLGRSDIWRFNQDGVMVARAGGSISGRVLDPNGAPVAGVSVLAQAAGGSYSMANIGQTNARGEFRIGRLSASDYTLTPNVIGASKIEWVPGEGARVEVAEAGSAVAPDMKMIPGGAIEMRLVDEVTGKGVAGASVFLDSPRYNIADVLSSQVTDAEGRAVLRVAPGRQKVVMPRSWPSGDYLAPAHSTWNDATEVVVGAGESKGVLWKLSKGLRASGRIVDEKGQPIPGASVSFIPERYEVTDSKTAWSDASGRWSVGGMEPGKWKPSADGMEWRVVSPDWLSLPREGAQDIVLAPVAALALGGRVVDGEGQPLPGVRVRLKAHSYQGAAGSETGREVTTGADGTWSVPDVPAIAYEVAVQVGRVGYMVERAPSATKTEEIWKVSDAILIRRDARLGGQILGADGQPAPRAQVLVGSTHDMASADEAGRWSLGDLPRGASEVVAAQGADAGVATVRAPNEAVALRLKAPPMLAARDFDAAQSVLEEAWETSRGSKYDERDTLPAILAASDPDAALALAGGAAKKPSSAAIYQIVRVLAQAGDLDALQNWTRQHLDALEDPFDRERALLRVAEALAGKDDGAAKAWLALARTGYAALKDDAQRGLSAQRMAVLGARLKEADAEALFEAALALAKSSGEGTDARESLARAVAPWSEAWAEKVIQSAAGQPAAQGAPNPTLLLVGNAVAHMARTNLPGARRLMAKYGDLGPDAYSGLIFSQARAQVLGQRAKNGEDVDALLKEAGTDFQAGRAVSLIAQNAPRERQAELFGRALELARPSSQISLEILGHLIPVDRAAAKAVLDRMRAGLQAPRDEDEELRRLRAREVAQWAWVARLADPAGARLLIEREWALGAALPIGGTDDWYRWRYMGYLAIAMIPLDIERAQQLASRLPVMDERFSSFDAQRAIAKWMMASVEERATKPMEFWNTDREEDGRTPLGW